MDQPSSNIYLNVPFAEKDQVKKLGARWDADGRGWFISNRIPRSSFSRWLPRMFQSGANPPHLVSEMIPGGNWYINLRALLPSDEWREIRHMCTDRAGNRCQVCGGRGPHWPVECNEQWQYIESPDTPGVGIQKLRRLVALCPPCHWAKHLGKAHIDGNYDDALTQLSYVNGWTDEQCEAHADQAFNEWERRSAMSWRFDLSILPSLGITQLKLSAYDFDPPPALDGIPVVVHPTFAQQFNHDAGYIRLENVLHPYQCGPLFSDEALAPGVWPGSNPFLDD